MIGIHSQAEAEHAVWLSEKASLSAHMAFDLEFEIPRHYRLPGPIFPLHIVVGPDGEVVHIDNAPEIDVLVDALDRILPER